MPRKHDAPPIRPLAPDGRKTVSEFLPRVLIVDDRKENLFATREILERAGVAADEAESGSDALRLLLRNEYAVVLMDVQMPDMDGYETVALMRQHPRTKDVPVIFLTAIHTNEQFEDKGYTVGAVDYLAKPIKSETLVSKVRVFIELAARQVELQDSLNQLERLGRHNNLILDHTVEGILGVDATGKIVSANPAAERLLKYQPGALVGTMLPAIAADSDDTQEPSTGKTDLSILNAIASGREHREMDGIFLCNDGARLPTEYSFAPFLPVADKNKDGRRETEGGVLIFQDIGRRKMAEAELLRMSTEDPLTGLPNRTFLKEVIQAAIKRHERNNTCMAFLMLDLDRFKHINDSHGHDVGDKVLIEVSDRFQTVLRGGDVVARLGGDEFGISLDGISQPVHAARVAEKIIASLESPIEIENHKLWVGASIGVAIYPDNADNAPDLIKAADIAMYDAKKNGRNAYHFFTSEMQTQAVARSLFEQDLTRGLPDQFSFVYQPLVDAQTMKPTGMEALARWTHPEQGHISPDKFIPVAEESGFIVPLGEHLLRSACHQAQEWISEGLIQPHHRVALNVSTRQLTRGELVETLRNALEETDLSPEKLEIEVTESTLMADPDVVISILKEVRDMGITIELDDFGTGFSSLSRLSRLPLNGLKIDRSFVNNLMTSATDQAIVLATIKLAHSMQLRVTAEGVETLDQVRFLQNHGCDRLQGYYFAEPTAGTEFAAVFASFDDDSAINLATAEPTALQEIASNS